MITWKKGNIFDSKAECLVVPVNCRGVMGAGLALDFDERYNLKEEFKERCKMGLVRTGEVTHVEVLEDRYNSRMIMYFPTKDDWRNPSKMEWIEAGLKYWVDQWNAVEGGGWDYKSIAFPILGGGLGGLDKNKVKEVMVKYLSKLKYNIIVEIWEI